MTSKGLFSEKQSKVLSQEAFCRKVGEGTSWRDEKNPPLLDVLVTKASSDIENLSVRNSIGKSEYEGHRTTLNMLGLVATAASNMNSCSKAGQVDWGVPEDEARVRSKWNKSVTACT